VARSAALALGKPLYPVNHGVAHIEIGKLLTGCSDPVVLYVAGGNTLITTLAEKRYRILGETLDIAAGNCLDAFRNLGRYRAYAGARRIRPQRP
jgi:N6-L-threonylcarbamoyladenine synthase